MSEKRKIKSKNAMAADKLKAEADERARKLRGDSEAESWHSLAGVNVTLWSRSFPVISVFEEIPEFGEVEVEAEPEPELDMEAEAKPTPIEEEEEKEEEGEKPESPHPYLCCHHGGSPTCEEYNRKHGFECPKCQAELRAEAVKTGDSEIRPGDEVITVDELRCVVISRLPENKVLLADNSKLISREIDTLDHIDSQLGGNTVSTRQASPPPPTVAATSAEGLILRRLADIETKLDRVVKFGNVLIDISSFRPRDKVIVLGKIMEIEEVVSIVGGSGPKSCTVRIKKPTA